jgi:hypothetical protein
LNAGHTPTASTNPYRLRVGTQETTPGSPYEYGPTPGNAVCLACHAAGDNGVSRNSAGDALALEDSNLDVDTAHFGDKHQQPEGGELCWDCHDPHGVPNNLVMIKDQVSQASDQYGVPSATVLVEFTDNTQNVGGFVEITNVPRRGMCQACHAIKNGDPEADPTASTKWWRNDGSDFDAATSDHNIGTLCTDCHFHTDNFKGSGGDCLGCHGDASGAPGRRAVDGDFSQNSHHVGASLDSTGAALYSQPNMGGALTNFDCVVCHAEGFVNANNETDTTGQPHQDGVIDLRNTDNSTAYYSYDKDSITGASNTWMSGNASWEAATPALDKFCLSCHDLDGAAATFNSGANEGLGFSGSATNPFADGDPGTPRITNEYDQVDRGAVVNIRNKVDAYVDDSNNPITPEDRDDTDGGPRGANLQVDPTDGIYSRHAIRGDGTFGAPSVYGSSQIPTNRWEARPSGGSWNDTSLMGCADCHTTDGANGDTGNAHGAGTEYLLKNKDGSSATEPSFVIRDAAISQINCYKCHNPTWYSRLNGKTGSHTDNNSDWVWSSNEVGDARRTADASIYGLPCGNCHGGFGFGSIHGTSDQFLINSGPAQRRAYRFMNGASLRYYDPNGWNTTTFTCYTLTNAQAGTDSWGGCAQHDQGGSGATFSRQTVRDLNY